MATYGSSIYGIDKYGLSQATGSYPGSPQPIPVVDYAYLIHNMTASPVDYANITITWDAVDQFTMSTVSEFRLLSNPWGFPVDENDGTILADLTGSPIAQITQYTDGTVTPGTLAYYGIYMLVTSSGSWVRCGFATALLPVNHGSGTRLYQLMPDYFQNFGVSNPPVAPMTELTAPVVPASGAPLVNPYDTNTTIWLSDYSTAVMVNGISLGYVQRFTLPVGATVILGYASQTPKWQWTSIPQLSPSTAIASYLNVLGYGLDYLRTQYDFELASLNDPMKMSLGDLQNLCGELGVPFSSEIPAYDMRKAALYWARVMKERGTINGIAEHITLLTGYNVDLQVSRNILLDDDQSIPLDPVYPTWSAGTPYVTGNIVTYPVPVAWNVISVYTTGDVVQYNGQLYTATTTITGTPPGGAGWSQNVAGPYTYAALKNVTSLPGPAPSGSLSNDITNTWGAIYAGDKNGTEYTEILHIAGLLANAGTWEALLPAGTALTSDVGVGFPNPTTWVQGSGTPQTIPNGMTHTIRALNATGSTVSNAWLRSVSRSSSSLVYPDPQLVVEHAVPVPQFGSEILTWSSTAEYHTNDIVRFGNTDFIALRGSAGAQPPAIGTPLNPDYDFESSFSGVWIAGTSGMTLTQVTSPVFHGTYSAQVNFTGTASQTNLNSAQIPVIPGATYSVTGFCYAEATGQQGHINIAYSDPFGNSAGSANTGAISFPQNVWTPFTVPFTVPSNCYSVSIHAVNTNPSPPSSFTVNVAWDLVMMTCTATPEWAPLAKDGRIPVVISGYALDDLGAVTPSPSSTLVTPFIEWYDSWGNFIDRVFATTEANYVWDSFATGSGAPLLGRTTDDGSEIWSQPVGTWSVSANGSVYAGSTVSLGIVQVASSGFQAATITQAAPSSHDIGVLFWYENATNFWFAGVSALHVMIAGSLTTIAYTSGSLAVGDRIIVETNTGVPEVTVFANTVSGTPLITLTSFPGGAFVPGGSTSYGGIIMEAV